MKASIAAIALVAALSGPPSASAQTVDQLLADRALLNAELDRCKQLGMASIDDPRCKTAREAENKRFFGSGTTYTPSAPANVFPSNPTIDPQSVKQKTPSTRGSPSNG